MKCLSCGYELDNNSNACPRCSYPVVEIIGTYDKSVIEDLKKDAENYRNSILAKYSLEVINYSWDRYDTNPSGNKESILSFGNCDRLFHKVQWAQNSFDFIWRGLYAFIPVFLVTPTTRTRLEVQIPRPGIVGDLLLGATIKDGLVLNLIITSDSSDFFFSNDIYLIS